MEREQRIGRIQRVDLRAAWRREPEDFTVWLFDNISELGEALGMNLEATERESPVRNRSLDILATERPSGRPVIIENQLEISDNDHLARLLIYAAGKDADAVVWIAQEFEDEHWAVLQWLNARSGTDTRFFGVAIEALSIDNSRPAPHFRVVVAPNEWRKRNVGSQRAHIRAMHSKYRDFRMELMEKLSENPSLPAASDADHSNPWLVLRRDEGMGYSVDFRNGFSVSLQLDTRDGVSLEWCHAAYDRLLGDRERIELQLDQLRWERDWQRNRGSSISVDHGNQLEMLEHPEWGELHVWIAEQYERFLEVFEPYRTELQGMRMP